MIVDPEVRRVDTSIPNISWSETQFVQISLNSQKTGNGVPRMLPPNVLFFSVGVGSTFLAAKSGHHALCFMSRVVQVGAYRLNHLVC
jgi:hypothetical protein